MSKRIDLIGQRFGKLVALDRTTATKSSGNKYSLWRCLCDCGKETRVPLSDITSGNTKTCGHCYRPAINRTHGMSQSGSRVYGAWCGMRDRCFNKNNRAYKNYGGRGITVCERWAVFEKFMEDMGEPADGMSLDRINNDGNYEPSNCRWATVHTQRRNSRRIINITIKGHTLCLQDWCEIRGLPYPRVRARIKKLGWTIERALEVST